MTKINFQHNVAYGGVQTATAQITADGALQLSDVGYYEETITLSPQQMAQLGYVAMTAPVVPLVDVAKELLACAASWEADAKLVGNVRAADVARLCRAFLGAAAALQES